MSATSTAVHDRILAGPDDNIDRLLATKDKLMARGVDCQLIWLTDIKQYAVVRVVATY